MAVSNPQIVHDMSPKGEQRGFVRLSDARGGVAYADIITGTGAPSGAYGRDSSATMQYLRQDPASNADASYITFDGGTTWAAQSAAPVGAAASGTGVSVTADTASARTMTLTLADVDLVMADEAGVVAYGSLKIADMPAGAIQFLGAVLDLDLTLSAAGINADWDGDIGLGTTAADNDATLATTEQNIVPTTATPQAVASVTTGNAQSTITQAGLVVDGTATAVDVYLNILVDDADHDVTGTATNIIANGTVKITYIVLGDY